MAKSGTGESVQLAKKAADVVRDLIARGELLPGEKINQMDVAERAGISRSPLREALRTLEADRIVSYEANRGYVVSRFRMSELSEIYRLRHLLEAEMLDHIAKPDDEAVERLQDNIDAMAKAVEAKDFPGMTLAHRAFFQEMYRLAQLPIFLGEVERLWAMTDGYTAMHRMPDDVAQRMLNDHRSILKALAAGRLARAKEIARTFPEITEQVVVGLPPWR